ncbi:MAG: rhodanese-like domain-containing protein [Desulfobacteraceae bacterium]|nr:rhodanese-like domain-containing protein [Desulfobacteraceae bacterium]
MKNILRTAIFPVIMLVMTIGILWFHHQTGLPRQSSPENVALEARNGGYQLISSEALWQLYKTTPRDILIVDTRQGWEYRSGHIRGAVNFPMEPTWTARWTSGRKLKQLLGPDKDRSIFFY